MATIQQRLQAAFEARGWVVDTNHRTNRYVVMKATEKIEFFVIANGIPIPVPFDQEFHGKRRYFLGKKGSCRYSPNGNVTNSIPREGVAAKLLREEVS